MNRLFSLALVFCLLSGISVCADPFLALKCFPDIEEILKRKKLIVAIHKNKDSKPYRFEENGKLIGYEIELAKKIAQAIDPSIEVEFLATAETYNDIVGQVAKGEADIALSSLSYTTERSKRVLYVKQPYIKLYTALLVDRHELEKMPKDVNIKTLFTEKNPNSICVLGNSSNHKLVENLYPCAKLVLTKSSKETLSFLKEHKCIAYLSDSDSVHSDMMTDRKLNLNYLSIVVKDLDDPYYLLVNPSSPGLFNFITMLFEKKPELLTTLEKIYSDYKEYYK